MTTVYRTERVYRRKPSENLRRLFRLARAAQSLTGKPLTCVNALRPNLRHENNIRHEGRYRHVEKTFSASDSDLHRSHRAATGIRSATAATGRSTPRVLWARALASYVGRWLRLALLVDVPTDDAMHDCHFCCHLFSRPWFMRPWMPFSGAAVTNVGCPEPLGVADTQRTLCAWRNPEGRVRGEKGCDPLGWIAIAYKSRLVSKRLRDFSRVQR